MIRPAGQATQDRKQRAVAEELHLCNNYRHLLFALADILGRKAAACILYLEDEAPLSDAFKQRLHDGYPDVEMIYTTDAAQIAEFRGIPLTGVLRRNLRFDGVRGFKTATRWHLPLLTGLRFKTGYFYHSGLFSAKPASASCDRVVLRESGLNNYVSLPVAWPKALVRLACGRSPFSQVWGEERWVDAMEVTYPQQLPLAVRAKGKALTFAQLLGRLDTDQSTALAHLFVPAPPVFEASDVRRAVLLTQPLDTIGLCTAAQKHAIYQQIVAVLHRQGYEIHVKHHPTETPYALDGCATLASKFPIELWAILGLPRFSIAVALCSASLIEGETLVAERVVQLLQSTDFNPEHLGRWRATLPEGLSALEHHAVPVEA